MSYCTYCKHDTINGGSEEACEKCSVWDESWEEEDTAFNFEQDSKYDGVVI